MNQIHQFRYDQKFFQNVEQYLKSVFIVFLFRCKIKSFQKKTNNTTTFRFFLVHIEEKLFQKEFFQITFSFYNAFHVIFPVLKNEENSYSCKFLHKKRKSVKQVFSLQKMIFIPVFFLH